MIIANYKNKDKSNFLIKGTLDKNIMHIRLLIEINFLNLIKNYA